MSLEVTVIVNSAQSGGYFFVSLAELQTKKILPEGRWFPAVRIVTALPRAPNPEGEGGSVFPKSFPDEKLPVLEVFHDSRWSRCQPLYVLCK